MHALFLDTPGQDLRGPVSMLGQAERGWSLELAGSAPEALRRLSETRWDAIITPSRVVDGAGLGVLAIARLRQPAAARMLLIDSPDGKLAAQRAIDVAHRVLDGVPSPAALRAVLHVLTIAELRAPQELRDSIGAIDALPAGGGTVRRLQSLMEDDRAGVDQISRVIAEDPGLAAKVLHLANSGFAGPSGEISDLGQAAALLGLQMLTEVILASLALSAAVELGVSMDTVEAASAHGVAAARAARELPGLPPHAAVAGLLLDIGLPMMALTWPHEHKVLRQQARQNRSSLSELERETFGVTHSDAGAHLLRRWSLPDPIVEAVAGHHFVPLSSSPDPRALGFLLHHAVQSVPGPGRDLFHAPVPNELPDWVQDLRLSA